MTDTVWSPPTCEINLCYWLYSTISTCMAGACNDCPINRSVRLKRSFNQIESIFCFTFTQKESEPTPGTHCGLKTPAGKASVRCLMPLFPHTSLHSVHVLADNYRHREKKSPEEKTGEGYLQTPAVIHGVNSVKESGVCVFTADV